MPTHEVSVRVGMLDCSAVNSHLVQDTLKLASRLLTKQCGLRLRYRGLKTIAAGAEACRLPADTKSRIKAVQAFSLPFRRGHEKELTLFVLAKTSNLRLAWSHYDRNAPPGCAWPPTDDDRDFLRPLASVFMTEFAFVGEQRNTTLYFVHELVHALTHKGHPTKRRPGNLMADHTADVGEILTADQCDCLLQSPWVKKL